MQRRVSWKPARRASRSVHAVVNAATARVARATGALPPPLAEHRLTPAQIRDVASKVSLQRVPNKGMGLVAKRALPANTVVGVYGGKVYTADAHERLTSLGITTGKYAIDFYKLGPDRRAREGYIMDPGAGDRMHPTHARVLAAYINEPAMGQTPNCVWVRNYETNTMEVRTTRAVRRGEELTTCYGDQYPRKYKTPCTRSPGALHVLKRGATRPTPL